MKEGMINLKGMAFTKNFLMESGLALAGLIDQPQSDNGIIHVRFCHAAELIKDMQQAINLWLEDYYPVIDALKEYNEIKSATPKDE